MRQALLAHRTEFKALRKLVQQKPPKISCVGRKFRPTTFTFLLPAIEVRKYWTGPSRMKYRPQWTTFFPATSTYFPLWK